MLLLFFSAECEYCANRPVPDAYAVASIESWVLVDQRRSSVIMIMFRTQAEANQCGRLVLQEPYDVRPVKFDPLPLPMWGEFHVPGTFAVPTECTCATVHLDPGQPQLNSRQPSAYLV